MKKPLIRKLILPEGTDTPSLFGTHDRNLRMVERAYGVRLMARGEEVTIQGERACVQWAEKAIFNLASLVKEGAPLTVEEVNGTLRSFDRRGSSFSADEVVQTSIPVSGKRNPIIPKSAVQEEYLNSINTNDIVVGIGPAGTGKTYLAMAMAVSFFLRKEVSRIVFTRPVVEAGERLGFLPGDIAEKVSPYLRPLYDALYDMMEVEKAKRLLELGDVEIAPLAFMRGRTLNDSFIILDEAQNATSEQMKMFLTRLGFRSKAVITGDITQADLPKERISGLIEIQDILEDVSGIKFVYFTEKDIVRHRLVQEIVKAYERYGRKKRK